MGLIEQAQLVAGISPPINLSLAASLVSEFISIERRFIQRDWEPAELDGGQFCEVLARILYHVDSGIESLRKPFDECVGYLTNESVSHSITPRTDCLHLVQALRTIYKFRSQRGAVHISPHYAPNEMDARLVVELVRWCFAETLRVFWNQDRQLVAKAIRELLQFDVPCIGSFENELLVQRTDLSAEEEILLLLHYAGEVGFSRTQLGRFARCSAPSVTRAIQTLESPARREVLKLGNGNYRLTDLGAKRVRERLSEKLALSA